MSRWLADACAVIGFYRSAPGFPASVRGILENEPGNVVVPATAIWEVAIKTALGRLPDIRTGGHASLAGMLAAHGFDLVSLDPATAEQAANLPPFHADPFDRALVALAQRTGRTVLTSDRVIGRYGVPVSW